MRAMDGSNHDAAVQALAGRSAAAICTAFEDYNDSFRSITQRAQRRFEMREWQLGQRDAVERIELYDHRVERCLAGLVGMLRGARRAWRAPRSVDAPLLFLTAITLAGYVLYTWRNPWYVTVKGSYLLGLALPFAAWSSEVLVDWLRGPRWRTAAVGGALVALAAACALAFTWGTPLWTMTFGVDLPGLRTVPVGG